MLLYSRVRVRQSSSEFPDLKADVRADKADQTSLLIHGFWLG